VCRRLRWDGGRTIGRGLVTGFWLGPYWSGLSGESRTDFGGVSCELVMCAESQISRAGRIWDGICQTSQRQRLRYGTCLGGHLLLVWLHNTRGKRGKCEVWCQGEDHSCKRRVRHFPHEGSGEEASAIL
jgi:hypothetical protein